VALAHTLPRRTSLLPDMPSIAETIPKYNYSAWNGIIAPAKTPQPILDRLHKSLVATMARAEVKAAFAAQATEIVVSTPAEFRALVQETIASNIKLVKALGLQVD
jgi:hypothetical protein